jgi:hypothetical protein
MRKHTASSASSINSRLPLMGIFYFRILTTAWRNCFWNSCDVGWFLFIDGWRWDWSKIHEKFGFLMGIFEMILRP